VNGIVDLIQDAVSGYFIERDAASIAIYLRQLGSDRPALGRMGAEARSAAATRSWRSVVELHRALYSSLRARQPRR
jgi:glycosyltransferase involved in cell wall biosynthesis